MLNLLDLTKSELEQLCVENGQPKFRAIQLIKWVHNKGVKDFSKMTDIQGSFRDYLKGKLNVYIPEIIQPTKSADGSEKSLFKLKSGEVVESVVIPEGDRITACVSSQVGCAVDCSFCATGHQGFSRNLSLGEMLGQVWAINYLSDLGRVTNVVLMGMGEPLLNYSNVKELLKFLLMDEAYGLSRRKVTVSTSGIVPFIDRLRIDCPVSLAVSLHAANNELRDKLVPINRKYPLEQLMRACKDYQDSAPRKFITFEVVLLDGVNDSLKDALAMSHLVKNYSVNAKFNLIPYNNFSGGHFKKPAFEKIKDFQMKLQELGYVTTVRKTRGDDVEGACGQLSGIVNNRIAKAGSQEKTEIAGLF